LGYPDNPGIFGQDDSDFKNIGAGKTKGGFSDRQTQEFYMDGKIKNEAVISRLVLFKLDDFL
jgi:hypothetical protein